MGFPIALSGGEKGCFPIGLSRFVNIEVRGMFFDNFVKVCCIVGKMNFVNVNLFIKGGEKECFITTLLTRFVYMVGGMGVREGMFPDNFVEVC